MWVLETGIRAQMTRVLIGALGMSAGLNRGEDTPVWSATAGLQVGL